MKKAIDFLSKVPVYLKISRQAYVNIDMPGKSNYRQKKDEKKEQKHHTFSKNNLVENMNTNSPK